MGPDAGMRMSLCVWRKRPVSGSNVNPSTPEPTVKTKTVVALKEIGTIEMRA
jgi:hypothetical protein